MPMGMLMFPGSLIAMITALVLAAPAAADVRVFDAYGTPVEGPPPAWFAVPDGGTYPESAWNADRTARAVVRYVQPKGDPCAYPDRRLVLVRRELRRTLVADGDPVFFAWSPDGGQLAVEVEPAPADVRGRRRPWPKRIQRDYEMFSRAGDAAMRRIVVRAATALRAGAAREGVLRRVRLDFERVAKRHGEAEDTASSEALALALDPWLTAAGWRPVEALDEVRC